MIMGRLWKNPLRDRRSNFGEAGYTLVEVLIALSLVALLSVGLASGVGTGTRVWERVDQRSQLLGEAVVLDDIIRSHLQKAVPVLVDSTLHRSSVFFDGTATQVRFLTTASAGVASRGIFGEEFEIRETASGRMLQVRRAGEPLRQLAQPPATWEVASIPLSNDGLRFEYYGQTENDNQVRWHEDWRERNRLPQLIRLSLGSRRDADGGAHAEFVDIVVRPRMVSATIKAPVQSVSSFFEGGGA